MYLAQMPAAPLCENSQLATLFVVAVADPFKLYSVRKRALFQPVTAWYTSVHTKHLAYAALACTVTPCRSSAPAVTNDRCAF